MFMIRITVAGAVDFSAATAITTFLEARDITQLAPAIVPRICGYSYNSLGAAHTVNLRLSEAPASAVNLQIPLFAPTTTHNSFSSICGKDGKIVPRQWGLTNSISQVPDTTFGASNNAAPMVLLFSTSGKAGDGTLRVWYDYVELGGLS